MEVALQDPVCRADKGWQEVIKRTPPAISGMGRSPVWDRDCHVPTTEEISRMLSRKGHRWRIVVLSIRDLILAMGMEMAEVMATAETGMGGTVPIIITTTIMDITRVMALVTRGTAIRDTVMGMAIIISPRTTPTSPIIRLVGRTSESRISCSGSALACIPMDMDMDTTITTTAVIATE